MIVTVLFIVFMVLALAPFVPGSPLTNGAPFLWLAVLMLYFMIHPIAGLG